MIKKINHVAVAVKNLEESAKFYEEMLGLSLSGVEVVASQKTRAGFLKIGESNIELVQPTEDGAPLSKFLETKGQGIHHICLEVEGIDELARQLTESGAVVGNGVPGPGAHGTRVIFLHPRATGGVLIELAEKGPEQHG